MWLRRACDVAVELTQGSSTPAVATTLGGQPPDWPRVRDFDYVEYLRQMAGHGYRGFVTVEISVMVQRRAGYDPLDAAARAYATLAAAFRRSGIRGDLR